MPELRITEDGSHTLYNSVVDECYHSTHGAVQESMHIFIQNALLFHEPQASLSVLEIGFGTGLNAWLTCVEAEKRQMQINYHALERYPVDAALYTQLNYVDGEEERRCFRLMHTCEWNVPIQLTTFFTLRKEKTDLLQWKAEQHYDLIYFDAFSPEKQPELWQEPIFAQLYAHTNPGGIFITYCAKGMVRRALQSVGYCVERIPGPPGKREILRAVRTL